MIKPPYKIGLWSGLIAFGATAVYVVVQILQVAGVLNYPADEVLIYGNFSFLLSEEMA